MNSEYPYKMIETGNAQYRKRVVFISTVFDKLIDRGIPFNFIKSIDFSLVLPAVSEESTGHMFKSVSKKLKLKLRVSNLSSP